MKASERRRHESETKGYCATLTDNQVRNVYADEKERSKRGGEIGAVAKIFAASARTELEKRGLL